MLNKHYKYDRSYFKKYVFLLRKKQSEEDDSSRF